MNQRLHLLNRRRNTTLIARHIRAVSMRHVPHQFIFSKKTIQIDEERIVEKTVSVEENKKEDVTVQEQPVIKEVKKEEKPKKNIRKEKKEQKAKDKEERLNRLIDEPKSSFFMYLTNPLRCIENAAGLDYSILSAGQIFVLNVIKWLLIGFCFSLAIANLINIDPFGFSRLNFSSTASLGFKFALYGFVFESLIAYILHFTSKAVNPNADKKRMVCICTVAAPFEILLFLIAIVFLYWNPAWGIAGTLCASLISFGLSGYGLSKTKLPHRISIFVVVICLFVAIVLFGAYFSLVAKNILDIFYNILNI